jgi:proline dehydrogenase
MLVRSIILKTSSLKLVERMVRHWRIFRPLVTRFIAGDTLDEALRASRALLDKGFLVTLDYLGENTKTEAEATTAKRTFIEMLEAIAKAVPSPIPTSPVSTGVQIKLGARSADLGITQPTNVASGQPSITPEPLNISIKLTQCGLDLGDEYAEKNYREVVWAAAEKHNFVRVDMEGSDYTQRTLKIVEKVWEDMRNTGTVLQSYLRRTHKDIDRIIELGMRVRLVKGAYLEPATVAIPDKKHVDEAYVVQAKKLIAHGFYPAIATHDENIINTLLAYVRSEEIDKSRFEFQMLYGIRRDLQDKLLKDGYRVRIYVPFGDQWYPYFTRRLAERPANAFFILKSLFKG